MDIFFSCVLMLTFFLILFIIFSFYIHGTKTQTLPRGKNGWPIIGESLEFVYTPERFVNERMKKYSPEIFKTSVANESVAVLCGPSGNKFVFSNENKQVMMPWWPPTMDKIFNSCNSSIVTLTKKTREIIPEFIKPQALQKYIPTMDSIICDQLEKEWGSNPSGEVKAFPLSKSMTFWLACKLFLSIEDPSLVSKFAHNYELVMAGLLSVPINLPGTAFNRAINAAKSIREELSPIIKKRRSELNEKSEEHNVDFLSKTLTWTDEDGKFLNENEISDMILGILIASLHTTSTVFTFIIYYLAGHPDVYAKVFQEHFEITKSKASNELLCWEDVKQMKYSRNVINEVMRLQPPAVGSFRHAITDFTYGNFSIPRGWKAFWSVYTTNKDPKYFPNPEKFDPSRFEGKGPAPFTFVPFGGGANMCPGSEFARLLILVFMHRLVTKFKWEKLIPNEKIIYDLSPIPVNGLPIKLWPLGD